MVCIRLSGFVIMLMFTLLEARSFSNKQQANYQGIVGTKVALQSHNHGGRVILPNKIVKEMMHDNIQKDVVEEGNVMKVEGRKLANKGGFEKAKMEAKVSSEGELGGSENSGTIANDWRNAKNSQTTFKSKRGENGKGVTPLTNSRQQSGHRGRFDGSFQNLETHDLEAANEVCTLMNQDYPGNGKGHHNPPVNNR